jgi:tetratricopeptide (TPR) repeat protein
MLTEISKVKRAASHFVMLSFLVGVITATLDFTVGQAYADVSADFDQAEVYDDNGQYTQAAQVYQSIIAQHAGTAHALEAQKELTRMYVFSGQLQEALTAYRELIDSFSGYEGIAKTVCEVADSYLRPKPQKALELYQYVLDTWPDSKDVMWAQLGVVKVNLVLGNTSGAQAAYETLLSQFSRHQHIPEAVYEVVDCYRASNPQKALELYEYAMNTWPNYNKWVDENDAMLRLKNLVLLKLVLGDDSGAQAAYGGMITLSEDDNAVAEAVTEVADVCLNIGKHEKALQFYQYAKDRWAGSGSSVIWAHVGLVKTDIVLGSDPNCTGLDKLLADFSADPDLAKAIYTVAEQYHYVALAKKNQGNNKQAKEYFGKAISVGIKLIKDLLNPVDADLSSEVRYLIGQSYQESGDLKKAVEYYEQVVADWPNNAHAWAAQFRIGLSWEQLEKAGSVTKSEVQSNIRSAYQKVLQDYPDCPAAKAARAWLQSHGKSN